ncbi:MAG: protease modulator HflC [Akkermansiaceae bacterium]|jgi:modulator of FtsH protease HflC|nr:protease modulator HflC [Akkermansiaceae bacterium]MDP4645973.1 protease modulator HflC [Akkermansiaceae bacterium]MDP4721841.1 protease modulator HflC [Akkermansiaceae bacterium]MDP4781183.1 protease modulator HflC [Akkermansiaceae bacterium]MDP4848549.1 protease modulator HflC [Akkermansiaceae bacterium]
MKKLPLTLAAFFIGIIVFIFYICSYTIKPTEQVIITQFGEAKGEPIADAGLHFKKPFIQVVNSIPKNILPWDGTRIDMPTKDKLYISVDTFGRWRITDPLEYFRRLRDERSAESRIDDILGSSTRSIIGKHDLIEIVRTDKDRTPAKDEALEEMTEGQSSNIGILPKIRKGRSALEDEIMEEAAPQLAELGIELMDIRFKRINYNPSVVVKIYDRMISERQQIASKFRSEGEGEAARILGDKERDLNGIASEAYKQVQTIRGKADAEASAIYARAYGQNPKAAELYEFIKTMEMYRNTVGEKSTLVLSTDSDLFKFMKSSDAAAAAPQSDTPSRRVVQPEEE